MPQTDPGGVVELTPVDAATVRWRQIAGPAAWWGQGSDGVCMTAAPLVADGGTVVMRQEWPWLPLPTPGFETGAAGVDYLYGVTAAPDATVLDPSGSRSMKITPTVNWAGPVFVTPVTAGKSYTFTAMVRAASATPGYKVNLAVDWKDSGGASLGDVSSSPVTPPNGTWLQLTYTGTAPANATAANITVENGVLSNPQPYWLGRVDGRDTSTTLQVRDHVVSIAPAARARRTAAGDVAVARRRPALILMDSVNSDMGGAYLGGAAWTAHTEGAASSALQVWRDVSDASRFRFIVGEPGTPGGTVQRAELYGGSRPLNRASTWWWSAAFRISGPPPSSSWMNLMQVHQSPDAGEYEGPPPLNVYWQGSGRLIVGRRYDPNTASTSTSYSEVETELAPSLTTGMWHRIVMRIRLDKGGSGGATGSLGVWLNGAQKLNATNVPFGYNDAAEPYPKFGIYRGVGAGVNVAEFANVEIGTTDLTPRITAPLPVEF